MLSFSSMIILLIFVNHAKFIPAISLPLRKLCFWVFSIALVILLNCDLRAYRTLKKYSNCFKWSHNNMGWTWLQFQFNEMLCCLWFRDEILRISFIHYKLRYSPNFFLLWKFSTVKYCSTFEPVCLRMIIIAGSRI